MREVKEVLDELDIKFWLASGALLGAIREGRFLPWDPDIDVGTSDVYLSKMKMICEKFNEHGFSAYYSHYNSIVGLWKDGASVDIPFWRLGDERATAPLRYSENALGKLLAYTDWILLFSHSGSLEMDNRNGIKFAFSRYWLTKTTDILPESAKLSIAKILRRLATWTGNRRGLVAVPVEFYQQLDVVNFYGMDILRPADVEGYLTYYFGSDWRTPKKEWNYVRSDKKILSKTECVGETWQYLKFKKQSNGSIA